MMQKPEASWYFNPIPISASPPKKPPQLAAAPRSLSFLEQTTAEESLNASFGVTALRRETQFRQLSRQYATAVWQKLATKATTDSERLNLDDLRVDLNSDERSTASEEELQRSFKYEL